MEKLDSFVKSTIHIKEKHLGFVNTALFYAEQGGKLTDIFSRKKKKATMRENDSFDVVFLKNGSSGIRRAAVVMAKARLNGAVIKTTNKPDMFCSNCVGNCAK